MDEARMWIKHGTNLCTSISTHSEIGFAQKPIDVERLTTGSLVLGSVNCDTPCTGPPR
jgi:hypothetical protein